MTRDHQADPYDELPHSDDAERALLGAVVRHPDALAGVLADLDGKDFFHPARGVVWDACRALSADREPIDPTAVARWLVAHDRWSAASLSGGVRQVVQVEMLQHGSDTSATFARRYAEQITEDARRRNLIALSQRIGQLARQRPGDTSDVLAEIRAIVDEHDRVAAPREGGPLRWDALVDEFEAAQAPGGSRPGIPSPWLELDQILGGLFGGRVYVLGARPGAGKSTAAIAIAVHAAVEHGREALIVSKEMPSVDVTGRIFAAGAEVELSRINSRGLDDYDRQRIREYVKRVDRPGITVDTAPRSLAGIKALARAHHHRHGLDVLVVDYVQLVRTDTPSRTREQEVAEVSRQLKELSLELDCVTVLPAQLNRESTRRGDGRPTMADLRDSGQVEQDADAVILLHRPPGENGAPGNLVHFIVDKNRHGPTAEIGLVWRGGYGAIG